MVTAVRPSRARAVRAALGVASAMVVLGAWLSGCSSSKDDKQSACDSTYKGICGSSCQTDTDCKHAGVYCNTQGKCTADCSANGEVCADGVKICDTSGRCQDSSLLFHGDSGLGSMSGPDCVVDRRRGEGRPADIYIMNDQSKSMSCAIPTGGDRWTAMKSALSNFVQSQNAAGLGVGIQYFGTDLSGSGNDSCNAQDYANADVEIAPLPGNAQPLIDSLGRHGPSTYTPTPAALQGAASHAIQWQTAHPDRVTTIVLATDGQPNLCGNRNDRIGSVADIAAQTLAGTPPIRTYVIGIVGGSAANGGQGCNLDPAPPNKPDLDRVAAAGGTTEALIVDAANGDTAAQFLDALNKIRGAAVIPCEYVMPSDSTIDPNKVNIQFTPSGGTPTELLQAANASQCDPTSGGWYYDDPQNPKTILLCPAICDQVKADAKTAVDVNIGCRDTQKITR